MVVERKPISFLEKDLIYWDDVTQRQSFANLALQDNGAAALYNPRAVLASLRKPQMSRT